MASKAASSKMMDDLRLSILRFLDLSQEPVDFSKLSRATNTSQAELAAELVILVSDRNEVRIVQSDGEQFFEITEKGKNELQNAEHSR